MTSQTDGGTQGIDLDWDVYDSAGDKIGKVDEVGPNYVAVAKGLILPKTIYVPTSAISGTEQGRVYVNVTKDQIENMGWDEPDTATGSFGQTAGGDSDYAQATQYAETGQYAETDRYAETAPPATGTDSARVQRVEEDLQAQKTTAETGEVRVRKDVTEEERTLEVPVAREEVQVRSRTVDRPATETDSTLQEGGEIRVPVRQEQVQVTKEPRVVEELEIEKVAREDTERVSDTVRREQINVEDEGQVRRVD